MHELLEVIVPIQMRLGDTDMHGHVNNISYLSFVEAGHLAFEKKYKMTSSHIRPFVASTTINYLSTANLYDEAEVRVYTKNAGNSSLVIGFEVRDARDSKKVFASGEITLVFINIKTHEKVLVVDILRQCQLG